MRLPLHRLRLLCALVLAIACSPKPQEPSAFQERAVRSEERKFGLWVEVIREGQGTSEESSAEVEAKEGDWVEIHYTVSLEDGTIIDSSHDGKARGFLLLKPSDLIDGVHQGVAGMKQGELRRLIIPPKLGYRGRSVGNIPGDANLVFDVELMRLKLM